MVKGPMNRAVGLITAALRWAHLEQAPGLALTCEIGAGLSAERSLSICRHSFRCPLLLLIVRLDFGEIDLQQGVGSRIYPRQCTFLLFPAGTSRTQETKSFQPCRRLLEEKCIVAFSFLDSHGFLQAKLSCVSLPPSGIGDKSLKRRKIFC